ncbi:hypothetical protein [Streptomyces synnematoformans]|uniref:hypothetical protein n=1 Tax=Streptomyces synnematoformans TaxID=415721 RepID=UPI0031E1CAA8
MAGNSAEPGGSPEWAREPGPPEPAESGQPKEGAGWAEWTEPAEPAEEERALRALQVPAVPRLVAPTERMERIRGRVLRRRRRRRAVWGATATAAALGGLLPQVLPADDPPPRYAPPAAGAGTPQPREDEARLPELSDLTLRVPEGWSTRTVRTDSPEGSYVGYVASLALKPSPEPCPTGADGTCTTPPRELPRRGTLITLRLLYGSEKFSGPERTDPGLQARDVGKPCVVAGGTEELWAVRRPAGAAEGVQVLATVCLATPANRDVAEVRTVLGSMRFESGTQPGSRPDVPSGSRPEVPSGSPPDVLSGIEQNVQVSGSEWGGR